MKKISLLALGLIINFSDMVRANIVETTYTDGGVAAKEYSQKIEEAKKNNPELVFRVADITGVREIFCPDAYTEYDKNIFKKQKGSMEGDELFDVYDENGKVIGASHNSIPYLELDKNLKRPLTEIIDKNILAKYGTITLYWKYASYSSYGFEKCNKDYGYVNKIQINKDNIDEWCVKSSEYLGDILNRYDLAEDKEGHDKIQILSGENEDCEKIKAGPTQKPIIKKTYIGVMYWKGALYNKLNSIDLDKVANENDVKSNCANFDFKTLNELKGLLTASSVSSGIGAVSGAAGTGIGIANAVNAKKKDDKNLNKKLNLAQTITAGVSTATATTSTATSITALKKLEELKKQIESCVNSAKKL